MKAQNLFTLFAKGNVWGESGTKVDGLMNLDCGSGWLKCRREWVEKVKKWDKKGFACTVN